MKPGIFGIPETVQGEELADCQYKLVYLAQFIKTSEGVFTFPDGDFVETSKLTPGEDAAALRAENAKLRAQVRGLTSQVEAFLGVGK